MEVKEDGTRVPFTFSGVNIFWLGASYDNPDLPFGPPRCIDESHDEPFPMPRFSHPSQFRIDNVLFSAMSMGARVVGWRVEHPPCQVRSHTLGVSTGGGQFHGYGLGWAEVGGA